MPKVKKKRPPKLVCEPNSRDYVMARIAAARTSAQAFVDTCDEILGHFTDPAEDKDGEERDGAFDVGAEALGAASVSFGEAHRVWDEDDDESMLEGEEDYPDEDEDEEGDEDDDED